MERKKEYILGKARDVVEIGSDWFDYRTDEVELPKIGAFCKKCCKETAIPIHPISMNGKPAYALRCPKCGNEYPMYKSMYIKRYVGYDLANGGHVNATHGQISTVSAMDKKAKAYYNQSENRVENRMCKAFGFTHEEYREMKNEWAQDEKEQHKKFEREKAEQHQVVVFVHGKNSTASLKTGTITKIYHGRFQEECSVDGNPHILQNRVMKLEKMEE